MDELLKDNSCDWITEGNGLQDICFSRASKLSHTAFLARDIKKNSGVKNYNSYENYDKMIEYMDQCNDKSHYEIIRWQCIEYYDFDYDNEYLIKFKEKYDKDSCPNTSFIYDFIDIRNEFFTNLFDKKLIEFNPTINFHDVIILDSTRPTKTSIHLLVRPLEKFHYFEDISIQKKIMVKFKEFLNTYKKSHIIKLDLTVYGSNSLFRCVGQTKFGGDSYLIPFGNRAKFVTDKKDFLCSHIPSISSSSITLKEEETIKTKYAEIDYSDSQSEKDILTIWNLIKESVVNNTNKYLCDGKTGKIEYDKWKNLASALFKYLPDNLCISIFPELYSLYRNCNPNNENSQLRTLLQTKGKYGFNIGSLHMWANCHDNYNTKFPNILQQKVKNYISGTHFDLAKLFFVLYGKKNIKITSQQDLSYFQWDEDLLLWVECKKESLIKLVSEIILPIVFEKIKLLELELQNNSPESMKKPIKLKLYGSKNSLIEQICLIDIEQNDSRSTLKKMKLIELQDYLQDLHNEYTSELENSKIDSNNKDPQLEIDILQKLIQNLKSTPFTNNVCKAIGSYKINPDFEPKIINKSTFELPIKEGLVINLKTLETRKRTKKDYWSFECPVSFSLSYNLDSVNKFFNDICCNDMSLKNYHQLLWGYLLTGEIKDRSLHIFYGNGCNGKSSITNIFRNILSNFYVSLSEDITIKKSSRGASPELMDLLYSRCGSLPESDKKEELNSKRIKTITGDDEINARHLFGHSIKFKTQCKLIWSTNHKPKINIDDQAIIDRLKLIPFKARFDKNQINTDYIKDLQENKLNEFFTWFCIGAKSWYSGVELIPCQIMKDAMLLYINDNDVIQDFIQDVLEIITKSDYDKCDKLEKVNNRTKKAIVYAMYNDWIRENLRKDEQLGKKEFYELFDKKCSSIKVNADYYICKMKKYEEEEIDGVDYLPSLLK